MNITKAIEALEDLLTLVDEDSEINHTDALKLGIEALKRVHAQQSHRSVSQRWLLPGETKEN